MKLAALLRHIPVSDVQGPLDRDVHHVTRDTRDVRPGSVFVAIAGVRVDGHDLIDQVGPEVILVERPVADAAAGATVIRVPDTKIALAGVAAALRGFPGRSVQVVGVTGTNGKTTVTTLVEQALRAAGRAVARVGTTGNAVNGVVRPASFTTPEAPELQAFLAELRDGGVGVLAMEVSSHGLAQHRVDGIPFALAVFTNLTQDHLEFHGTMDAYREAKARLFRELLRPPGGPPRAILCADDPNWAAMGAPEDRWLYGFDPSADIRVVDARFTSAGTVLELRTPRGEGVLRSALVGRHNAQNLAAAVGVCLALGVPLQDTLAAVGSAPGAPGRLEVVADSEGRLVVVDYAHTPDALEHALRTLRAVTRGRLWVVFGCGGDRDRSKRPRMGEIASRLADDVIVTSDNPRHESPETIIAEIVGGAPGARVEPDRERAIRLAIGAARAGDTVLIAGKGHEPYQQIGDVKRPFDDRRVARAALEGS